MIKKIIKYLYFFLFLVIPLVMNSITSELFEFNKMLCIYLLSVFILFFWVLRMIGQHRIIIKRTPIDIPIIIFLVSQIVSTFISIDVHTSLFGYYGRFNGGLLSIIAYLVIFYGFVSNFNKDDVEALLKFSLAVSFIVILWAIPGRYGYDLSCLVFTGQLSNNCWTDQFHPEIRAFSTLGQPNWLGAYLAINFFIGIYFLFKKNTKFNSLVIPYLLVNFIMVLFTRSRSALLSIWFILFAILVFGMVFLKNNLIIQAKEKKLFAGLIIIFICLSLIFKTGINSFDKYLNTSWWSDKVIQKSNQTNNISVGSSGVSESLDIRKIVWQGAFNLVKRYPIFGSGVETFAYAYYFTRPEEHNLTSEWDYLYNKAHNEYINYLATTGYFGLTAYLIMIGGFTFYLIKLISGLRSDKKVNNTNRLILTISLFMSYLMILITNFFGFSTTSINIYFYLIPGFVIVLNENEKEASLEEKINLNSFSFLQTVLLVIVFFAAVLTTNYFVSYYLADIKYARADLEAKAGNYNDSAELLKQALNLKYEHVYEDKLSVAMGNLAFLVSYQKPNNTTTEELIDSSLSLNKKSIEASPMNVLYWKTGAKNAYLFYQITLDKKYIEQGINALVQAEKFSPTDPKIPYSLAIFYSLMFDEEKNTLDKDKYQGLSLTAIENSVKLKPNYRDGYFLKAQLLKKFGQKAEAQSAYQFILDNLNPDDEEVKKEMIAN